MSIQVESLKFKGNSPFGLDNEDVYHQWRSEKLVDAQPILDDLLVTIANPYALSVQEKSKIIDRCERYNMAIYDLSDTSITDKSLVHELGHQLGMHQLDANLRSDEDSVTSLEVRSQVGNQYIPYTNKALSWHTDGYYNHLDKQIYGLIMHCVRPAESGGINGLLNPEEIYIALRDANPEFIEALYHPEAMTIPENIEDGEVLRAAQTGPVFMLRPDGRLHMRYSARKRNIIWRDTAATRDAVGFINRILADENRVLHVALKASQGLISNNVMHNRTGFTDNGRSTRLMYRGRYYDAVMR